MVRASWWLLVLLWLTTAVVSNPAGPMPRAEGPDDPLEPEEPDPDREALRCFQVTGPVLGPNGILAGNEKVGHPPGTYRSCKVHILEHVFSNSYGHPYVGQFKPPSCEFGRAIFNLTVVSEGRQYDRLGTLWVGDIEVWRTSTAEPRPHPGIVWSHIKDMTNFNSLWKKPQTIIFDLGNLVNERYTGSFNVSLTATFFDEYDVSGLGAGVPADLVVPVSARKSSQGLSSVFVYPQEQAECPIELPRNIRRAVLSVAATGQAAEEFWWSNVPDPVTKDFANVTLPGLGGFREVRVRIDDSLVGLTWPFPVVFTGGIAPPLHRPLVGIQAFDLAEHEVDITSWIGLICDGKSHNVSLEVVGENSVRVPQHWLLSAKIFVWLSSPGSVSRGEVPRVNITTPTFDLNLMVDPEKRSQYRQLAKRAFNVEAGLRIDDQKVLSEWHQLFTMKNEGTVAGGGDFQQVRASYRGQDKAFLDHMSVYQRNYRYPISTTYVTKRPTDGPYTMTMDANLTQGLEQIITGESAFASGLEPFVNKIFSQKHGVEILTMRHGRVSYYQREGGNSSGGFGNLRQTYAIGGHDPKNEDTSDFQAEPLLYNRDVTVINETVVRDKEFVYKPDMTLPERDSAAPRFMVENHLDQYAPVMANGLRGGSKAFSAKRFNLDLLNAGPPIKGSERSKTPNSKTPAHEKHVDLAGGPGAEPGAESEKKPIDAKPGAKSEKKPTDAEPGAESEKKPTDAEPGAESEKKPTIADDEGFEWPEPKHDKTNAEDEGDQKHNAMKSIEDMKHELDSGSV